MDELFVQFLIPCKCGTELEIHRQHFASEVGQWGVDTEVKCPKCGKTHYIPTKALRVFYRDGNGWRQAKSF
jgi:hypothetical protein